MGKLNDIIYNINEDLLAINVICTKYVALDVGSVKLICINDCKRKIMPNNLNLVHIFFRVLFENYAFVMITQYSTDNSFSYLFRALFRTFSRCYEKAKELEAWN